MKIKSVQSRCRVVFWTGLVLAPPLVVLSIFGPLSLPRRGPRRPPKRMEFVRLVAFALMQYENEYSEWPFDNAGGQHALALIADRMQAMPRESVYWPGRSRGRHTASMSKTTDPIVAE